MAWFVSGMFSWLQDTLVDVLQHTATMFLIYFGVLQLAPALFSRLFKRLSFKGRITIAMQVVSEYHAALVLFRTYRVLSATPKAVLCVDRYHADAFGTFAISLGYFVFDAVLSVRYYEYLHLESLLHAIGAIGVYLGALGGIIPIYFCLTGAVVECSTVIMNLFWIAQKVGAPPSIQKTLGSAFVGAFFISRVCLAPYFCFRLVKFYLETGAAYFRIGLVGALIVVMNSLNAYWFYRIVTSFRHRLRAISSNRAAE